MGDVMNIQQDIQPTPLPIITHGPKAGQTRPLTDVILDRLRATYVAACRLRYNGYSIRDVQILGRARPVVIVEHCKLCDEMVALNRAVHVVDGRDQCGPLRVGQFLIEDLRVHVEWEERGRH